MVLAILSRILFGVSLISVIGSLMMTLQLDQYRIVPILNEAKRHLWDYFLRIVI